VKAREKDTDENSSSSSWLLPLLIGLLLLCCLLGLIGYFCMNKSKRATKVNTAPKPKPKDETPLVASKDVAPPAPEVTPLVSGHWEQPMQMVPVTTAQPSVVPVTTAPPITTARVTAPPEISYLAPIVTTAAPIVETIAPTYTMAAPTYATSSIVETVAPTYAVAAPTYTSTPIVETVAPTYAMAPSIVETVVAPTYAMAAPTYASTPIVETVLAPTYGTAVATAPTGVYGTTGFTTAGFGTPTVLPTAGYTLQ
jgi:hypothetical protein